MNNRPAIGRRRLAPELMRMLEQAAVMRAAGATWYAVGERVGRHPASCRGWPKFYADVWDQLYEVALKIVSGKASADEYVRLRQEAREEAQDKRWEAIRAITELKRGPENSTANDSDARDSFVPFAKYLDTLSDEELEDLFQHSANLEAEEASWKAESSAGDGETAGAGPAPADSEVPVG